MANPAPWLAERYADPAPEPRPVAPKWDPLRRDLLPADFPELAHLTPWTEAVFLRFPVPTVATYLLRWSLVAVLAVQLVRLIGAWLLHPLILPLWVLLAVGFGVRTYLSTQHAWTALTVGLLFPLAFAAVLVTQAATGSPTAQVLTLAAALGAAGFLVDALGTHALATLAAHPALTAETRAALRRAWAERFSGQTPSTGEGSAGALPRVLAELSAYGLGFLLLPLLGVLSFVTDPLLLLLVLPPAAALLWTFRRAPPAPPRAIFTALGRAVSSWTHYGLRGEGSPGVFASPAGARLYRLALSATTVVLLAATLAPPTPYLARLPHVFTQEGALLALVFELLAVWLLPVLVLGSVMLAVLGRVLAACDRLEPADTAGGGDVEAARWETLVARLQAADNPRHRRQLLIGYHATEHYPVFLPVPTLREHAHILGATGGGKTSRAVLPLLAQLARFPKTPDPERQRGPIIVIDLKGEPYLFQAVRAEAQRANRPFRFFTNEAGNASHVFNPLLELRAAGLIGAQVAESIRAALNLEHGAGYGPGYFSAVTRGYLGDLFARFPDVQSFAELEALRVKHRPTLDRAAREREQQAYELISNLQLLARRETLNITEATAPAPEVFAERIQMARALDEDEVVYFFLRSHVEEAAVRYIASLAIECLYTACVRRSADHPGTSKAAYVFIDEFQIVAGRNFQLFMQQARSSGLALILSNQSREDLDTAGLLDAVDQNTAYRQTFSVRTPQAMRFLEELAGESVDTRWWEEGVDGPRLDHGPRLARNDVLTLSAHEDLSLALQAVNRDYSLFDGFPIVLRSPHHITRAQRDALAAERWPAASGATLVAGATGAGAPVAPGALPPVLPTPPPVPVDTPLAAAFRRIGVHPHGYTFEES